MPMSNFFLYVESPYTLVLALIVTVTVVRSKQPTLLRN